MNVLTSQIRTESGEFRRSLDDYHRLTATLVAVKERSYSRAQEKAQTLLVDRGKLPVAERVGRLADPQAPILELSPFAGYQVDEQDDAGAGIWTGITTVHGKPCMVVANDPLVKGGTYYPMTVSKHLRAQEIAEQNELPCVYLVDSGGAYLPLQDRVFPDKHHFGRIFFNQARMSAKGIPQIAAVLGSCTAGGAYVPAMSDETVMVRGNATIFLGGPPLVRAATGEVVSAEELGGADVHCSISGVADHLAPDEPTALARVRQILLTRGTGAHGPRITADQESRSPRYSPEEIPGIVGTDLRRAIDVREILARLLDDSRLDEFKRDYGTTIVCGFAHLCGYRVGIVANNGILFSEAALKATHFIELCNQRGVPLLFLQNIVGFMVGKQYEHEGIAKHGAKMVSAVATSRVPRYTVLVGASYGAGNYGMCGRAYEPRFLFSWPNSKTAVMGGAQAADVLTEVRRNSQTRRGGAPDEESLSKYHAEIKEQYEEQASALYGSARLWDDGIVHPADTRAALAIALASTCYNPAEPYRPGIFRM